MIFVALESTWDRFAYPVDVTRAVCGEGSESSWFCKRNQCAFLVGCLCDPFWMEPLIGVHVLALSASFVSPCRVRCIVSLFSPDCK